MHHVVGGTDYTKRRQKRKVGDAAVPGKMPRKKEGWLDGMLLELIQTGSSDSDTKESLLITGSNTR